MGKVIVKVIKFNGIDFPSGCNKEICCGDTMDVQSAKWKTPVLNGDGSLNKYQYSDGTASKPQSDSYKVVRVLDACNNDVEVIIEDDETAQIVRDACNVCCGDAAVEFSKTVPDILVEQSPCADANGDRKISVAVPAGGSLTLAASRNGTPFTVVGNPFANGAAIKTYMSASMSAFGTWSHNTTDNVITLTLASGTTSAGFTIV